MGPGVGGAQDAGFRGLVDQALEARPEAAHAAGRGLEVEHGDGHPVVDGVGPALLDPPEPVHLDQPHRPVPEGDPLVALHQGVVHAEGAGHVAQAVGGGDLEVAELGHRPGLGHLGVAAPQVEAVEQAPVEVLGRLAGPVGVGADDLDLLAVADALGQVEAAPVGLPAAQGGEAALGRVPLGLAVADDVDLGGHPEGPGRGLGDDLLGPGDLGPGPGHLQRLAVPDRRGRVGGLRVGPPLPEPAQVQRRGAVGLLGGVGAALGGGRLGPPALVAGQVQGRVGPLGPRQGRLRPVRWVLGHLAPSQLCTVRNRWLTAPS